MNRPPMQPPARQPIGFWTLRSGEAIRDRILTALAEIGVTQPQWWVLHQLSRHPGGVSRDEMVATIGPNDTPAVVEQAIDAAVANGWVEADGEHLRSTAAGTETFERAAQVQDALQAERMQGVTEEEYATTVSVLQRMTANVGGDAWHW